MKKTYTIIAALALAAAAYSQDGGNGLPPRLSPQADNLFQPSDCDEDGWLWFDTQDKIDRYVGSSAPPTIRLTTNATPCPTSRAWAPTAPSAPTAPAQAA